MSARRSWLDWFRVDGEAETRWQAAVAKAIARERAHRERLEAPISDPALAYRIANRGRFLRGKKVACVVLALFAYGCDKIVSEKRGTPTERMGETGCSHFDYCYKCGLGYDGKFSCAFQFSHFCPGTQPARLLITPITYTRESGAVETHAETVVVERMGACS